MTNIELDHATAQLLVDAITSGRYANLGEFLEDIKNSQGGSVRSRIPNMQEQIDLEQLASEQEIEPFEAANYSSPAFWPTDEDIDQFLAYLRCQRRDSEIG